jgi:hypothetical protein
MEETLEGGQGPPRAVAPLERERARKRKRFGYKFNIVLIDKKFGFLPLQFGFFIIQSFNHCRLCL